MKILDYTEKKGKDYFSYYILSAIVGVLLFIIILYLTKGSIIVIKFIIGYWLWFAIGIVGLLFLKKLLKNKKKTVIIQK